MGTEGSEGVGSGRYVARDGKGLTWPKDPKTRREERKKEKGEREQRKYLQKDGWKVEERKQRERLSGY